MNRVGTASLCEVLVGPFPIRIAGAMAKRNTLSSIVLGGRGLRCTLPASRRSRPVTRARLHIKRQVKRSFGIKCRATDSATYTTRNPVARATSQSAFSSSASKSPGLRPSAGSKGGSGTELPVEAIATTDDAYDIHRLLAVVKYRKQRRGSPRLEESRWG